MFMIRNWSMDASRDGDWNDSILISKDTYKFAYEYNTKNKVRQLGNPKKNEFVVCDDKDKKYICNDVLHERWEKCEFSFDELNKRLERVHKVCLNRDDWLKSKCTCSWFQKNYYCYHIMVVAVKEKLFEIPLEYLPIQIEANKARGKPSKMTKALNKVANEPKRRKIK